MRKPVSWLVARTNNVVANMECQNGDVAAAGGSGCGIRWARWRMRAALLFFSASQPSLSLHSTRPPRPCSTCGDPLLTVSVPAVRQSCPSFSPLHRNRGAASSLSALLGEAFRRRAGAPAHHQSHRLTINGVVDTSATLGKQPSAASLLVLTPIARHHRLTPRSAPTQPLSLG